MKHEISTYALLGILIAIQCVIIYYGVPSALDAFSEYWTGMVVEKTKGIVSCVENNMPDITGGL